MAQSFLKKQIMFQCPCSKFTNLIHHLFIVSEHVTKQAIDGSSSGRPKWTEGGSVLHIIINLYLHLCFIYGFLLKSSWKCEQNQGKPQVTKSLKWVVVRAPTTDPSISPPLHRTSQMRNVSVVHQLRLVSSVKWARQ